MKILHIVTGGFPGEPLKVALYQAYFSNLMGYDTYLLANYGDDVIEILTQGFTAHKSFR